MEAITFCTHLAVIFGNWHKEPHFYTPFQRRYSTTGTDLLTIIYRKSIHIRTTATRQRVASVCQPNSRVKVSSRSLLVCAFAIDCSLTVCSWAYNVSYVVLVAVVFIHLFFWGFLGKENPFRYSYVTIGELIPCRWSPKSRCCSKPEPICRGSTENLFTLFNHLFYLNLTLFIKHLW